ncbi:histone deacetylase complex subunit SAP18-like [Uloborus diversus]|uniref:histone deacetylase complex subunit SAP18-like n=1 Tax=Uloborus diversus TaxID=327109 RepID=UPI002409AEE6|nr:histone deacetylase complex subunit SAP18-like [Uloborus diversus]
MLGKRNEAVSSSDGGLNLKMSSVVDGRRDADKPIDREKTCPLLLRVFLNNGRHHSLGEFIRGNVPSNELQIYTWLDATLKELTNLVKEVNPDSRRKGTYFDFALVYPDVRGPGYRMRDIGTTCSGQKGPDDNKSLSSCRFKIGDYLDIAISPPSSRGHLPSRRGRYMY